ncbi:hypothetical protein ACU686_16415 [Yinghuangia aomiensis]
MISDSTVARTRCEEIWMTTPEHPQGLDPGADPHPIQPPPGSVIWRMVTLLPHRQIAAALAAGQTDGVDPSGFHLTKTVDHVFVLDNPVELLLDDESVIVHPGRPARTNRRGETTTRPR